MMALRQMAEMEQHGMMGETPANRAGAGGRGRNARNLMIRPPAPRFTYENQADSTEDRNAETAQRENV